MDIQNKKFKVERIVYYNTDSKWGVLGCSPVDGMESITYDLLNAFGNVALSGNFEGAYEGAIIEVSGDIVENATYGKQVQISSLKVLRDTSSREGIIDFLTRSTIKGISVKNAVKIYDNFGSSSLDVVLDTPDKLSSVRGIGSKTIDKIKDSVDNYKKHRVLYDYCTNLGFRFSLIEKLKDSLGDKAVSILKTDPYEILNVTDNISFKLIDNIYLKNGGSETNDKRLETGFTYSLKRLCILSGSTGCSSRQIKRQFYKELEIDESERYYEKTLYRLIEKEKIIVSSEALKDSSEGFVYLKEFTDIESSIADKINTLLYYDNTIGLKEVDQEVVEEEIHNFPFTLNAQQETAIRNGLDKRIYVLTGGAGCVDADTEYFNGEAWVPISKYRAGDKVLQYNKDGTAELVTPERYIKKPANVLYHMTDGKDSLVDMVLSEDHRFIYIDIHDEKIKEVPFSEVINSVAKTKSFYGLLIGGDGYINLALPDSSPLSIECVEPKDGMQYCFTVPSGMLVLRRNNNVFVTGNSGKSSITKAFYNIFTRCGFTVSLVSPTSKAARRLEECTGGEASTIHRYLGVGIDGIPHSGFHAVEDSVVIVDEASMVDINLFNHLLKTVTPSSRIILVGDNNQLPSVQAGNVLGDILSSFKVSSAFLTDVMRQSGNSNIIKYSFMTNDGEVFEPCSFKDFHYEEFGTAEELRSYIVKKYLGEVKKNSLMEVQVISPYKKGDLGMENLNKLLQDKYNKDGKEVKGKFKVGDRVRHTVNNYKEDVYNGEVGVVVSSEDYDLLNEHEDELGVDYGTRIVWYDNSLIEDLTLSYCATVHSSQGSEYKVVFIILDDSAINDYLFIRRLLYTAITRGKQKVYILAKPYLVDKCINNDSYKPRVTKLCEFLKKDFDIYNRK